VLSPELQIILSNSLIIAIAYLAVYPRFCGADIKKIAFNDCLATAVALCLAGSVFAGSELEFSLGVGSVNWFWFTLLTFMALETPVMFWYFKRNGLWPTGEH